MRTLTRTSVAIVAVAAAAFATCRVDRVVWVYRVRHYIVASRAEIEGVGIEGVGHWRITRQPNALTRVQSLLVRILMLELSL